MSSKPIREYNFFKQIIALTFVEQVWLFGSRARGDNTDRADIDLAILCPAATTADWEKILEIIAGADTLLKIDCVRFDALHDNDKFKQNIAQDKKVLYEKGVAVKEFFWQDYFLSLGCTIQRFGEVLRHKDLNVNDFMQDAAIQRFEFVIELFWKVLKKILRHEKIEATTPREVLAKAFQFNLVNDEAIWLKMLDDRNNTSHVYQQVEADRVFINLQTYLPIVEKTYNELKNRYKL